MIVRHELTMHCTCPVNGARDSYQVIVETNRAVNVEDILVAVRTMPDRMLQEDITQALAAALGCGVTTIGYHSGVKTTCQA